MKSKRVGDFHDEMMQSDVEYAREYTALEEKFSLAREVIQARRLANLTQQELANKMNTTQAVIARMEGGSLHRYGRWSVSLWPLARILK